VWDGFPLSRQTALHEVALRIGVLGHLVANSANRKIELGRWRLSLPWPAKSGKRRSNVHANPGRGLLEQNTRYRRVR